MNRKIFIRGFWAYCTVAVIGCGLHGSEWAARHPEIAPWFVLPWALFLLAAAVLTLGLALLLVFALLSPRPRPR